MPRHDAIDRLQLAASRQADDGTRDIALGLLLFTMAAGLDLGRVPVAMAVAIPLIVASLQFHLVWPRAGYAREPRRFVTEAALLFGLSFLTLLAIGATLGAAGLTGGAANGAEGRTRLLALAAILALPGLLSWVAQRRGLRRYHGYALAIVAAFVVGAVAGLEARAWVLALFALAVVAIGALRLRRFLAAHPRLPEGDDAG